MEHFPSNVVQVDFPSNVVPAYGLLGILAVVFIGLAFALIGIIAWCMIWKRAGYSWALGLLMLVPLANLCRLPHTCLLKVAGRA